MPDFELELEKALNKKTLRFPLNLQFFAEDGPGG